MAIFQHDNVLQWLFEGDPVCSSGYFGDTTQHDPDIYHGQYVGGQFETECSNIENDEIIAQALQEEFSQLSITEETGFSHVEQEHMQVPVHKSDWLSPSTGNYYSGHESGQEETDDIDISSLCSSPEVKLYDGEEYSYPLELTDESAFDGEVGKILNQMISVRHVPRINGEIPSNDEATSDHQRLLDRLQLYNLVELKVQGDGNCQFRALSDQFYRTPEHHKFVRRQIVNQLKSHPELYDGYVPMAYDDYLKKMSKKGEWGDHVTLQAAADSYGVRIFVITSFKDTCYIEILPKGHQQPKRVIFLSFWSEVHYNSIYPQGDDPQEEGIFNVEDTPSSESRKKKRWWGFGNKN